MRLRAQWAVLFIAINQLVFAANQIEGGARLSEKATVWLIVAALVGTAIWMFKMFTLFRRPT